MIPLLYIYIKEQIEFLTKELNSYNNNYYNKDVSIVLDNEFDRLLKELEELELKYPEFKYNNSPTQRIGGRINKNFTTVNHKYQMLSLSKAFNKKDIYYFDKRIKKLLKSNDNIEYVCELKFDGVAISLIYEDGILKKGITRGDGLKGDDITNNIKAINSIPYFIEKTHKIPKIFEVRAEVVISKRNFTYLNEQINKKNLEIEKDEKENLQGQKKVKSKINLMSNPRNTASGTLKLLDPSIVAQRNLDCYAYNLIIDNDIFNTHEKNLYLLKKWRFSVSNSFKKCVSINEVIKYIEEWRNKRYELPEEIDGIVIKVNDIGIQNKLGNTSKYPRWAVAYKYQSERVSTQLKSITYQVGRTGAVTPVANLVPVQLGGTIISKTSLYNANKMEELSLCLNDTVYIEKGGEIIPKIVGIDINKRVNFIKIPFIENCPSCNSILFQSKNGIIHYCINELECPSQVINRIVHFVQRKAMNIRTLNFKTIKQLYEKGLISIPSDLYRLTKNDLLQLDHFSERASDNLLRGINESKETPFNRVLYALGIRHLGIDMANILSNHFKSIERLQLASMEDLISISKVGNKVAESVITFFSNSKNIEEINKLQIYGIKMFLDSQEKRENMSLIDMRFMVSGVFKDFNRESLKNTIQKYGGKIVSSISNKLNYLVIGEKPVEKKIEKAKMYKIKIIDEEKFIQMINEKHGV